MDISINLEDREKLLIRACMNQEEWAQRKLYESFYGKMMSVCLRYAKNPDDALDILQDGFMKVFRSIHTYHPGTSLHSWVRRIMVNTSIDYYRKEKRKGTQSLEVVERSISYNPTVIAKLDAEEILKALQQLSHSYRAVFNLFVIEGYSHKEIASLLNIAESTSRSNLLKARTQLKNILKNYGIEKGA